MKKFLEVLQQQDGALCALQFAIVAGFTAFWVAWLLVSLKNHALADCPAGLATLLGAMLAAKVWKDIADYKATPPTP
jgi:L-lactate permease